MFHLQTLELVHWDYCQRVSLPLDASIITIAGPNGSGKTTLLDAMRTLLGLRCSAPRDYRTYARHAGAQTAWLRAVVDNRPQGRQSSSRPFARRLWSCTTFRPMPSSVSAGPAGRAPRRTL